MFLQQSVFLLQPDEIFVFPLRSYLVLGLPLLQVPNLFAVLLDFIVQQLYGVLHLSIVAFALVGLFEDSLEVLVFPPQILDILLLCLELVFQHDYSEKIVYNEGCLLRLLLKSYSIKIYTLDGLQNIFVYRKN